VCTALRKQYLRGLSECNNDRRSDASGSDSTTGACSEKRRRRNRASSYYSTLANDKRKLQKNPLQMRHSERIFMPRSVTENLWCRRHSVFGCVCPMSIREWVCESMRPKKLVNSICQKQMKGISPNFGQAGVFWLIDMLIIFSGQRSRSQQAMTRKTCEHHVKNEQGNFT